MYGHSAGGHLAGCMPAADWSALGMRADAVPGACAISGVFDLTPLIGISMDPQSATVKRLAALGKRVSGSGSVKR